MSNVLEVRDVDRDIDHVTEGPAPGETGGAPRGGTAVHGRGGRRRQVAVALGAVAAAAALGPLLGDFARSLWSREHYRFAPVLLCAAAVIGFRRIRSARASGLVPGRAAVGTVLWALGLASSAVAVLGGSPLAAVAATAILLAAAAHELGGRALLGSLLPVLGLLVIAVPPPFGWDGLVVVEMQKGATAAASVALDLVGLRHLPEGVVIRLPGREFFVDEACSGIHSFFASVAATAVVCVVARYGASRSAVLLAATVGWVLVANAIRVCAVVFLATRYDLPVTEGVGHEALGVATFALVIGLSLSTDRFLAFVAPQGDGFFVRFAAALGRSLGRGRPAAIAVPGRAGSGFAAAFAAGGLFAIAAASFAFPPASAAGSGAPIAAEARLRPVAEQTLPAEWNGWRRVGFETRERAAGDLAGAYSRIWSFRKGRLAASVSIDGPFYEWHDTNLCYTALNYGTVSSRDVAVPEAPGAVFTELRLEKEGRRHGYVVFLAYGEPDTPLGPPRAARRDPLTRRIFGALESRLARRGPEEPASRFVYQVQVFTESEIDFTAAEADELTGLFHEMRGRIAAAHAPAARAGGSTASAPAAGGA